MNSMPNRLRRGSSVFRTTIISTLAAAILFAWLGVAAEQKADPKTAAGLGIFQQHVRLILAHHCVKCHSGKEPESEFDMTTRAGLLRGGSEGKSIVPGSAESSRLVKLIRHAEEPHMPQDAAKLSAIEIGHVVDWINAGAPYDKPLAAEETDPNEWTARKVPETARQHWAFQPLLRVAPPAVKNEVWTRTPIDRFVLAKMEERGLSPSPAADKRKLIRRAYFDLVGLPPTPEEVEAFVGDESPDAYKKLIDRLLDSPRYGERWARYWLDVSRFAESHGFEQDYDRPHAYHFRDFVVKALNQDMPFDQFVRWQLAGDELAPNEPLALMATGFLGAGVFPTQITANEVERTRYDALDDMAATTGTAMLGLTIGCARCHDHKFDPIPQADYYRFVSTFTTTVRSEIDADLNPSVYREAKARFDREHAPLVNARDEYERKVLPARLVEWETARTADKTRVSEKWLVLDLASLRSQGGATFAKQNDGSVLVSGANPNTETLTFTAVVNAKDVIAVRLEALAHPSLVKGGPGRATNGNFALSDFRATATSKFGDAKPVELKFGAARATFEQKGMPVKAAVDGDPKTAWAVDPQFGKDHATVFELAEPIGLDGEIDLTITLKFDANIGHGIGRPRLSLTTAPRPVDLSGGSTPQGVAAALALPREKRTADQQAAILHWYRPLDDQWRRLTDAVEQHLRGEPKPQLTKVMICSEGLKPVRHHTQGADFFNETHYLQRGDCDKKRGVAPPGFLQVLSTSPDMAKHWHKSPPSGWRTSYRRASLADWITDTKHGAGQLLARVIVNRLWQHHFGRGIVSTPSDFGKQGARPTHPELLDALATELIANGWRLKPLHRLMMNSATYTQAVAQDEAKAKIDPENQWHWRRTRRRLEAEAIRDSMLFVCGALDERMYGPGTLDEGMRRRSIYFMVKRSQLIPMMQLFDSPEPLVSVGDRPATTIAPQALLVMNNPHVRSWTREFGQRLAAAAEKSPEEAVRRGYVAALGRVPTAGELADSVRFVQQQTASYAAAKQSNSLELAWADFCQVLLGLNEFVYIE